ncbi:MAG TPA: Sec-independent protein translocase protein TatB [Usitatibacter sp.]|nr:Sec-independent protein translocase protein TatB [Usitatibacter sp.]
MFDFGFSKLFLLGIVALVVIGPERLPKVARTMGHLYGRLQRYVTQVKADINREMEAADLGKMKSEFESAARSFQSEVESSVRSIESQARETQASVEKALDVQATAANEPAAAPADAAPAGPGADAEAPTAQLELGIEEPDPPAARDRAHG